MGSNKEPDIVLDHYSPECPICKGVLLPEKVAELEEKNVMLRGEVDRLFEGRKTEQIHVGRLVKEMDRLRKEVFRLHAMADQWRDLYQAREA